MFCSKCGKTIKAGEEKCPHCQTPVGANRFEGMPYTSVQPRFEPGANADFAQMGYTRTTYTGLDPQSETGEADEKTTYRPAYEGASAPEDVRRDMRATVDQEDEPPRAPRPDDEGFRRRVDMLDQELELEDVDFSQFKSRPIVAQRKAGISPDVADYVSRLEANEERKASRKGAPRPQAARTGGYDDYAVPAGGEEGEYPEDVRYDDEPRGGGLPGLGNLDLKKLLMIAGALVLVAALVVGGFALIRNVAGKSGGSPIVGVSKDLYDSGIALIEQNAAADHANALIAQYQSDGLVSVTTALAADSAAVTALIPESPQVNDQLFVDALSAIQSNVGNAVTMDVLALTDKSDTALADSEARWQIVSNSVALLKAATSAEELTGIINGQQISVAATATPVPTAAYTTLSKGDKSDAVLDLQNRLYELGFYLEDRDGAYGTNTQTAVKLFQATAKLTVTGVADSATQEAMYAADAPRTQYAAAVATPVASAQEAAPEETPAPEG